MHQEPVADWISLDFEQARAKHLLFKSRLRSILYGVEVQEGPVISHLECTVGKWIYEHALDAYAHIPEIHHLETIHKNLHTVAAKLVALYKQDKVQDARKGLDEMETIADELVLLFSVVENKVKESNWPLTNTDDGSASAIHLEEIKELHQLNQLLDNRIKQQSHELSVANERFELISKATQDVIWDWNLLTNTIWWNERFKELFGYKQQDIEPDVDSWYKRIHPDDKDWVVNDIHKTIDNGGKQWSAEYRFRKADGTYATVFDRAYALHDADGKPYRMLGSMQDITLRKTAEQALVLNEANLRNIVIQAPVAMCILSGPAFIVDVANDRVLELWGKSRDEIMGKPVFDVLIEAGKQGLHKAMTEVYTTGNPFTANELPLKLSKDGKIETTYVNFVYEPFKKTDGSIGGVMVVGFDVTDQVLARMNVEESQKEFQFVTDFMPQMIWVTRPDGYHYYYNKQWYDYTGLTPGETEGEGWNLVFHPDDQEKAWKIWQHSLDTGEPYEIEYRCRRYDGKYRWFLGRALPLKDEAGVILKWFGTCTDIDDQRRGAELMEHQVEERTRELKQVNEQLKQFAYSASHDLQEPLRKIGFFVDRLMTAIGPNQTEATKQITDKIIHTTGRMRTLIDDLLAYSNSTIGASSLVAVDLNEVVKSVLDDIEVTLIQRSAVVDVQALPTITGDQPQLRQLFQNLISNAVKYHKKDKAPKIVISSRQVKGGEMKRIATTENEEKRYHLIEVRDNGIGFNAEDADRIFLLFQRLHGKAEYEGTGVGLAIVQKVVENHNGYIWAESKLDEGAVFRVLLPA